MVDIGIVTWNRLTLTKKCLNALADNTLHPHRIFVADNGSTDGTREYLQDLLSQGRINRLLLFSSNVGIAPASNSLWELSDSDSFVKIDNDIEVRRPDWLSDMVHLCRRNPEIALLAFSFQHQFHRVTYPELTFPTGDRVQDPRPNNLGGGCIMIPRNTHEMLGFWCEDYAPYSEEDTDYSFRAAYAGLGFFYLPDTDYMIHHEVGKHDGFDLAAYIAFKRERRKETLRKLGVFHINDLLYKTKVRPLKMRRRFLTVVETDGVHARLEINKSYYEDELKKVRDFREELKQNASLRALFREVEVFGQKESVFDIYDRENQ